MNETRLAHIGIIVNGKESVPALNELLGAYGDYIVGRMGLPMPARGISVISVVIDAPADAINSLTGKLGGLKGVSAKTLFSKAE